MKWLLPIVLAGCASPPTVVSVPEPVTVSVPIPVSCVSSIPPRPTLTTDQELAAMSDYQFILSIRRNELLYRTYTTELEAILQACR